MDTTYEFGVVKFFNTNVGKRFGFIRLHGGEEVFFHVNDGCNFCINEIARKVEFDEQTRAHRDPQKGDRVVFVRTTGSHGRPKASPWGFREDFERDLAICGHLPFHTDVAEPRNKAIVYTDEALQLQEALLGIADAIIRMQEALRGDKTLPDFDDGHMITCSYCLETYWSEDGHPFGTLCPVFGDVD